MAEVFRASVVDVSEASYTLELTGKENKLEAFIEACRPYGIKNMVRTGTVAMSRVKRKT